MRSLLSIATALWMPATALLATPVFDVVDLGTLGGGSSIANAINNHGDIVGRATTADGFSHAFLYRDGKMRDLGTLGGEESSADVINDRGDIAGTSGLSGTSNISAFFFSHGTMSPMGIMGYPGSNEIYIRGINRKGAVLISSVPDDDYSVNGNYLCEEGQITKLKELSDVFAIDDQGRILGSVGENRTRILDGGKLISPKGLGDISAAPFAINGRGQIAGTLFDNGSSGFFYDQGRITEIRPGWRSSGDFRALALNEAGAIVGYHETKNSRFEAFLFYPGSPALPLKRLAVENPLLSSFRAFEGAYDINDRGEIVGLGTTTEGTIRAFLLRPRAWLIVDPGVRLVTSARQLRIYGTALGAVTEVRYRDRRHRGFKRASGTRNWHFVTPLNHGRNNVTIRTSGPRGSDVVSLIVRRP